MGSVFGVGDVVSQRHGQGSAMGVVMESIMGFVMGIPNICHRRKKNRICVKKIARCKLFKIERKKCIFLHTMGISGYLLGVFHCFWV